jgi:hypothetical protein
MDQTVGIHKNNLDLKGLTVSCILQFGLPSGLFTSVFPHQKPVYISLLPAHVTCRTLLSLPGLVTLIICSEGYIWGSSLYAVFSSIQLLPPSDRFFSAPYC